MGKASRDKGARGERMWRDVCRAEGYDAERGCQLYQRGSEVADVIGLPGIHVECKFQERVSIRDWMSQSVADAAKDELPIVAHKKSREGWLVTMRAEDWFRLYREYEPGSGIDRDEMTMLAFALRYALPRHTYAPEIACNYIAGKITQMSVPQIKQLIKELDDAEKYSMYGDEEARVTGYKLLHKLMDALDGEAVDNDRAAGTDGGTA